MTWTRFSARTGGARTSGGCRPGACSACHRDHPLGRRAAARRAGLGAWLARDTGILSRRCRTTRRNILLKPALSASCRKTNMTGNQSGCLVPRTTLRGAGGGSDAVRRQVIQLAAGFARTRRRPLSFPGLPDDLMCPGFPESGCRILVMLRAGSGRLEVRLRSG